MTFNAQIAIGENETTEFKTAFNQEAVESVCALANRRGGTVFLGVKSADCVLDESSSLDEEAPKYEAVSGGIKVTVFARKKKDKVADKFLAEDKIREILEENPGCKVGDVMKRTGFSDSYVRKILARLCASRLAERRGSRKTGGFYLVDAPDLRGKKIVKLFPERIDNGRETAPSKRILQVILDYDKVTAGLDSLKLVGIEKLMAKCSHFAEWAGKMEGIG